MKRCTNLSRKYIRAFSTSKKLLQHWQSFWRQSKKLMRIYKLSTRYWFIKFYIFFFMIKRDSTYAILTRLMKYQSWFTFIRCIKLCFHAFKRFLFSSYLNIFESFSNRKMKKKMIDVDVSTWMTKENLLIIISIIIWAKVSRSKSFETRKKDVYVNSIEMKKII